MNNVIISPQYPIFGRQLRASGYHVIPSERILSFISYEQHHADMQCLIIDDTAFVLGCCDRLAEALSATYHVVRCANDIQGEYPLNVPLNAAVVGKRLIANLHSLDCQVKQYCDSNGYELIHVNQGYAKCSCAVVSDTSVITADNGIYNSLKEKSIDVLKIMSGSIALPGADYGFIGGASGLDTDAHTLYFCGDIRRHPDYERIAEFCNKHGTDIVSLTNTGLQDVGGMIFC